MHKSIHDDDQLHCMFSAHATTATARTRSPPDAAPPVDIQRGELRRPHPSPPAALVQAQVPDEAVPRVLQPRREEGVALLLPTVHHLARALSRGVLHRVPQTQDGAVGDEHGDLNGLQRWEGLLKLTAAVINTACRLLLLRVATILIQPWLTGALLVMNLGFTV